MLKTLKKIIREAENTVDDMELATDELDDENAEDIEDIFLGEPCETQAGDNDEEDPELGELIETIPATESSNKKHPLGCTCEECASKQDIDLEQVIESMIPESNL